MTKPALLERRPAKISRATALTFCFVAHLYPKGALHFSGCALPATAMGMVLLALSPAAHATTTISTATTDPLATSTAGDITVDSAGSITLTSGTAITVDSDNALSFSGAINMSGSESNSTGILISDIANRTQTLTLGGNITVTDDYYATDYTSADGDTDGYVEAPWATGTGRYGILSSGVNPFIGNVAITSTIDVEGNESYGVRFQNQVDGTFSYTGATTIIGDNSTAISLEGGVTGNVRIGGSASVTGENSKAISITGDIGGNLIIDGSYSGTAYSTTSRLTQSGYEDLVPSLNLLQSGPLVTIASNVKNGVLFGTTYTDTDSTNTDEDGDGQTDTDQTSASLTQYGSAPALLVGSSTQDITLGGLTYTSTALDPPAYNYGLIMRGGIYGYGVHPGVTATAMQLGGTGYTTTIDNGVQIAGTVAASAYGANPTGLLLGNGLVTPRLDIDGSITASVTSNTTSTTTDDVTTYTTVPGTAYAVDIASRASLPILTVGANHGIYATAYGSTSSATAIRDSSGTLTSITNNGVISASITATDDNADGTTDTVTGSAVAIDAQANTAGLTITQVDTGPDDDDIATPYILGKILLGSGNDTITSSGGYIYGAVDWGAGTGTFSLSDGAAYRGQMLSAGDIAMDIDGESSAVFLLDSSVKLSTLHVGDGSKLALTLDTSTPTTPIFTASGAITFDDGAELYLSPSTIITDPTTFTVMTGSSIHLGNMTTSTLDGFIPYIYHADLSTNATDTTLSVDFRLKTKEEGGYSDNEYTALKPVLAAISQESGAETAILSQTTKAGFDALYNQYLPDYSGETLLTLAQGSQSLNRSLGDLTLIPDNQGGQYWLQEYGFGTSRERGETAGFKSTGFSFAGGRERTLSDNQMAGVYMQLTASTPRDTFALSKENQTASDYTLGAYWRLKGDALKAWAHAGIGYDHFHTVREVLNTYVTHVSRADWSGYSTSAGTGVSYQYALSPAFTMTPQWLVDYYALNESHHSESGGGDYFDLSVGRRDGHLLSSTALVNFGYAQSFVKPELWVGYKQNVSATIGDTTANFLGGDAFTLTGGNIKGGGPVVGMRLSVDNEYSYFGFEAEYEKIRDVSNASLSLRTRFQF